MKYLWKIKSISCIFAGSLLLISCSHASEKKESIDNKSVESSAKNNYMSGYPIKEHTRNQEKITMDANSYYRLGIRKFQSKDYMGAISDFDALLEIDPYYLGAYSYRAAAKIELRDYKGAISDLDKDIDMGAQNGGAHAYRGIAKLELHNYLGAISDFNQALAMSPEYAFIYSNRGKAKIGLKDHQGAISDFKKAIAMEPTNGDFHYNLGIANINLGYKGNGCMDMKKAASLGSQPAAQWLHEAGGAWCLNMP